VSSRLSGLLRISRDLDVRLSRVFLLKEARLSDPSRGKTLDRRNSHLEGEISERRERRRVRWIVCFRKSL